MEPKKSATITATFIGLCVVVILICGGGLVAMMRATRSFVGSVERMSSGEDTFVVPPPDQIVSEYDFFNLQLEPFVIWDKEGLLLKVKATASERRIERLEFRRITLDDYLPDPKMPLTVWAIEPGKPRWIKVRFPGFSGRGGKNGKLVMRYSIRKGSEQGEEPKNIVIPLRKGR